MLGANTDPYQPAESKLKVTRSILEVLNKYNHPVAIITKSSLIARDIDILADMAKRHLAKVAVTITTLSTPLETNSRTSCFNAKSTIKYYSEF